MFSAKVTLKFQDSMTGVTGGLRNITSRKNKRTYQEQQNIRHTYRAHITRETLRLTLRTEIEEAKHNISKNHDINQRLVHKSH